MPYKSNSELPERVRENLPEHGQDIYREAFNNAWQEYKDPSERRGNESREEVSHKVAWSAVEKVYHKNSDGKWVKNED
jgi:cation transport regulator